MHARRTVPLVNEGLLATETSLTLESITECIYEWRSAVFNYECRKVKIIELMGSQ